jgi:hypothetical protein
MRKTVVGVAILVVVLSSGAFGRAKEVPVILGGIPLDRIIRRIDSETVEVKHDSRDGPGWPDTKEPVVVDNSQAGVPQVNLPEAERILQMYREILESWQERREGMLARGGSAEDIEKSRLHLVQSIAEMEEYLEKYGDILRERERMLKEEEQ